MAPPPSAMRAEEARRSICCASSSPRPSPTALRRARSTAEEAGGGDLRGGGGALVLPGNDGDDGGGGGKRALDLQSASEASRPHTLALQRELLGRAAQLGAAHQASLKWREERRAALQQELTEARAQVEMLTAEVADAALAAGVASVVVSAVAECEGWRALEEKIKAEGLAAPGGAARCDGGLPLARTE